MKVEKSNKCSNAKYLGISIDSLVLICYNK